MRAKPTPRLLLLSLCAAFLGVVVGVLVGRRAAVKPASPVPSASVRFETAAIEDGELVLRVPHAEGSIVLDGDMDDPGWTRQSARTHALVGADGVTAARPYSEGRFVWGDGVLYVGLYAADEDLHAKGSQHDFPVPGDDTFHVVFSDGKTDRVFDCNPLGVLTDGTRPTGTQGPLDLRWESGAHVAYEVDGTVNQEADHDEEWVIEMAIPLEALGLRGEKGERLGLSLERCDTRKSGATSCGSWGLPRGEKPGNDATPKKGVLVLD